MRNKLIKAQYKTGLWARIFAKMIDIVIFFTLSLFAAPFGIMIGFFYLGICDSLYDGQSFGKRFVGFAVVSLEDNSPCSIKQSIIRNLPFLIPLLLFYVPVVGWLMGIFCNFVFATLELYCLYNQKSHRRVGDILANTCVAPMNPDQIEWRKPCIQS